MLLRAFETKVLTLLCVVTFLTACASESHVEGRTETLCDVKSGRCYRSPVGRHELDSFLHFVIFWVHDICALISFIGFIICLIFSKFSNMKKHIFVGKIVATVACVAALSGLVLVLFQYFHKLDDLLHIANRDIIINCVFPQFMCFLSTFINAFFIKLTIKHVLLLRLVILLIIFSFVINLNGIVFIINVLLSNDIGLIFKEVSFELLVILQFPIFLIDITNFYLIMSRRVQCDTGHISHHKLNIIFLCVIMFSGFTFNVAHDSCWIFDYPGIESVLIRLLIQITPIFVLINYNWHFICAVIFNKLGRRQN